MLSAIVVVEVGNFEKLSLFSTQKTREGRVDISTSTFGLRHRCICTPLPLSLCLCPVLEGEHSPHASASPTFGEVLYNSQRFKTKKRTRQRWRI
jgi:hypothetical protein